MRQIVLDTETTGLSVEDGHRILEIGCVEIQDRRLTRRTYHRYIDPEREIDLGALEIHGITSDSLQGKPKFAEVWDSFLEFIQGAELIIHNAPFDVAFINNEMRLLSKDLGKLTDYCTFLDSLVLARRKHPGQRNNLDALCKRYQIDSSRREVHGALLDAELLAEVYFLLTGGQATLGLGDEPRVSSTESVELRISSDRSALPVIKATEEEIIAHEAKLEQLDKSSEKGALWRALERQEP